MKEALYKVRVEHNEYGIFTIAEVMAIDKNEAEQKAKKHFQWVSGTPPERSRIGYVWIPKEHQYPYSI